MSSSIFRRVLQALIAVSVTASSALANSFYCEPVYQARFQKIQSQKTIRTVGKVVIGLGAGAAATAATFYAGKALKGLPDVTVEKEDPNLPGVTTPVTTSPEGWGLLVQIASPLVGGAVGVGVGKMVLNPEESLRYGYRLLASLGQSHESEGGFSPIAHFAVELGWKKGKSARWNQFLDETKDQNEATRLHSLQDWLAKIAAEDDFCRDGKARTFHQLAQFIRKKL